MGSAFTTQHIFIEHINHVYTIHSLEWEDDVCSPAGMAVCGTWGASRQPHLKFTEKTVCFFFFLEKKSTRHLYFSSTSHLMHDIKMVSLPLSLSFFPTFFPHHQQNRDMLGLKHPAGTDPGLWSCSCYCCSSGALKCGFKVVIQFKSN